MASPEQLIHWCYLSCKNQARGRKPLKTQLKKGHQEVVSSLLQIDLIYYLRDFKSPRKLECAFSRNR